MAITDGTGGGRRPMDISTPFQNIAPSIFVPAQTDLTKPRPSQSSEPSNPSSDAQARIDEHANAVQDNIYFMMQREKTRIHQECLQREAHLPPHLREQPGPAEGDDSSKNWMPANAAETEEILFIRTITAPPAREGYYEVPSNFTHVNCLHAKTDIEEPPRKYAEKMVLNLVKHGVQNLEGFSHHVRGVKEAKNWEIQNEATSKNSSFDEVAPGDRMDTS
ncbi:hypothetical protein M426DRAFT_152562 [Hypoxylon sp. CI-4A]|nr:hypothetical protein M426DRAFT_152562 [Hypoxylon sp. CI-4A]